MKEDWAFMGMGKGRILFGEGPFRKAQECPSGETAFYRNTFGLEVETPWLIPSRVEEISVAELRARFATYEREESLLSSDAWTEPEVDGFTAVFKEIQEQIEGEGLKKSVPVVAETAKGSKEDFFALVARLPELHENLHAYGYFIDGEGAVGASPEYLFRSYEGKLMTMALAGTATEEERDIFRSDEKEIQEHEYVAQTLLESLTPLGMTRRHQREVLSLGQLIHFYTRIDVELYESHRLDGLVHHLHPTPALGPLPRTPENLKQLREWRERLGCPSHFGAPFGVYGSGHLDLLVAIRMVAYSDGELKIPSGCGVIEASRLTNEWRELSLKRASVKKLF